MRKLRNMVDYYIPKKGDVFSNTSYKNPNELFECHSDSYIYFDSYMQATQLCVNALEKGNTTNSPRRFVVAIKKSGHGFEPEEGFIKKEI